MPLLLDLWHTQSARGEAGIGHCIRHIRVQHDECVDVLSLRWCTEISVGVLGRSGGCCLGDRVRYSPHAVFEAAESEARPGQRPGYQWTYSGTKGQ